MSLPPPPHPSISPSSAFVTLLWVVSLPLNCAEASQGLSDSPGAFPPEVTAEQVKQPNGSHSCWALRCKGTSPETCSHSENPGPSSGHSTSDLGVSFRAPGGSCHYANGPEATRSRARRPTRWPMHLGQVLSLPGPQSRHLERERVGPDQPFKGCLGWGRGSPRGPRSLRQGLDSLVLVPGACW